MLVKNPPHLTRLGTTALAVALAPFSVGIALILTRFSGSFLQPTPTPLFFAAVMISVMWGGLRAGLVAAALSTLAINFFLLPPLYALKPI